MFEIAREGPQANVDRLSHHTLLAMHIASKVLLEGVRIQAFTTNQMGVLACWS